MRREGEVKILDSTCPAIHAALQAGQKGLPFMPCALATSLLCYPTA
jgi:glutaconate CoA-transferase, subunit A